MTENTIDTRPIERKMNAIISLLMRIANDGHEATLKEQVRDLASFGFETAEIAEILGRTPGHVSKELSLLKKTR